MPFFGVPIRNGLPIGLGSVAGFGVQQFDPSLLFEGGTVPGAWYEPSDLSTMFTTDAGTTPVAMPGLGAAVPVGAMLDKRATGYSLFFDGAGDCLTTPNSADLQLGSTYTVEGWVYRTGTGTNIRIFSDGSAGVNNVDIYIASGTNFIAFFGGATNSAYVLPLNTWVHIALVVTAGIPALYANGIAQTLSGTLTGVNSTATTTRVIGALDPSLAAYGFVGNIFNLRVVKGTAVYTGNFTPPTAPLSPITGTSLLTCGTTWSGNPAITSVGNTRIDGLNPFTASPVGNHAISFNNTTARPELRARVNLLTYSEEFDNGAWVTDSRLTISANTTDTTDPLGGNTADKATETTDNGTHRLTQSFVASNNTNYIFSFYAKKGTRQWVWCSFNRDTNNVNQFFDLDNIVTGSSTSAGAGITKVSASITDEGNGWRKCVFTVAVATPSPTPGTSGGPFFGLASADGTASYAGTTSDFGYFWGADLRPANIGANVPAYQRIADANTYDTSGFPLYLLFEGAVGQRGMYTPANLNLSGTDKATVFAGVRKLADTQGSITELSATAATNNGSFNLFASVTGAARWLSALRGTALAYYEPQTYTAPITSVLSTSFDIAGASISDEIVPRVNGIVEQDNPTGANAGTGNFGTYPLYIGSRNNTSDWLNGQIYSLIIAGSAVSAGNISATEQWVAQRIGIAI